VYSSSTERDLPCEITHFECAHFNPSQAGQYSIYLPQRDGRLNWPGWLVAYRDSSPVGRQSFIQGLTGLAYVIYVDHLIIALTTTPCRY